MTSTFWVICKTKTTRKLEALSRWFQFPLPGTTAAPNHRGSGPQMEMSNQTNNVAPNLFRELGICYTAVEASPGFSAASPRKRRHAHTLRPPSCVATGSPYTWARYKVSPCNRRGKNKWSAGWGRALKARD